MKIQNRSQHVVFIDDSGISEEYNAYRLVDHSEVSGDVTTLYVGWLRTSSNHVKVRFKGKKTATIKQSGNVDAVSYALKDSPDGVATNSLTVEPNQFFYIVVNSSSSDRLFLYTDEDGTSPLLRVVHQYIHAGFMAMGEYNIDGYSNGSILSSIPDTVEDYQPNMSYYPELEVTRDYTNSSQYKYIPSEFKQPFRIKCNALLPVNTIPDGETDLATVFDRLRNRIYLPFETGEYAVLDANFFPKGLPLDVGWNCLDQKLVCLYPREVVQLDLTTKAEEVLYTLTDAAAPDFHAMHVGTYDHYYNSVFIGVTSTKLAVRIYQKSTSSSKSVREHAATDTETFTYPPTSTHTYNFVIPESDAYIHSRESSKAAYLNNVKGGCSIGIHGNADLDSTTFDSKAQPPVMLNATSHGTMTHGDYSATRYDGDVSNGHFVVLTYVSGIGLTALPIAHYLYTNGVAYNIWDEETIGSSIPFDTLVCKSGQTCESTTDYYRNRKLNPVVNIFAELYPDLPDRFTEYKSNYVIPELQTPISLKGLGNTGDVVPVNVFGSAVLEPVSGYPDYSHRLKISDESELSYVPIEEKYNLNVTVVNRQTGELKVSDRTLAKMSVDVNTKHLLSEDGTIDTYDLVMPRGDDQTAEFDIEILSCVGHCQFRKINYGHETRDPEVEFDYIRAVRVDRFHKTNVVDMTPVTDGVIILASFPADVKVWMNGALMLGSHTDDDGVFQEPHAFQCDNQATFAIEVRSPLTYDQRKVVNVSFNATVAPIVIETPPIQGAQVDGLTTATTQKHKATVCDHHQQLLPDRSVMDYFDNPYKTIDKELNAVINQNKYHADHSLSFQHLANNLLVDNAIIPTYHDRTISSLPDARTTMDHTQMSVLVPSKKIDFVYHARADMLSNFSTDWIHISSPQPHKRAMNYWTHTSSPQPHKRAMNYWVAATPPKPKLRDHNDWIYHDNLNHIATSMLLRALPAHYPHTSYPWFTEWVHYANFNHQAWVKPFVINPNESKTFEVDWVNYKHDDIVFAVSWVARPERDRVVWEKEWVKRSDIHRYLFASFDSVHKYTPHSTDVFGFTYVRHANIFAEALKARYSYSQYLVERPLNFIHPDNRYSVSRPVSYTRATRFYLPDMIDRKIADHDGTYVVYEDNPQGYFATEELAYQAAIEAGYDPESVLIMTQEYYPNAWIFSIRFPRTVICSKAVEYGYVRGG